MDGRDPCQGIGLDGLLSFLWARLSRLKAAKAIAKIERESMSVFNLKPLANVFLLAVIVNLTAFAAPRAFGQELPNGLKPYDKKAIDHYNHAVQMHASGNLSQAEEEYRAAVQDEPRLQEAWSNLAGLYSAERKTKEASEAETKAVSIRKETAALTNQYGEQLQSAGKTDEAIKEWKRALHLDPTLDSSRKHLKDAGASFIENPKP